MRTTLLNGLSAIRKDVYIVKYSDKSIAVFGNTKPIKEELKEMGARFNKFLKNPLTNTKQAGWILPISAKSEAKSLVDNFADDIGENEVDKFNKPTITRSRGVKAKFTFSQQLSLRRLAASRMSSIAQKSGFFANNAYSTSIRIYQEKKGDRAAYLEVYVQRSNGYEAEYFIEEELTIINKSGKILKSYDDDVKAYKVNNLEEMEAVNISTPNIKNWRDQGLKPRFHIGKTFFDDFEEVSFNPLAFGVPQKYKKRAFDKNYKKTPPRNVVERELLLGKFGVRKDEYFDGMQDMWVRYENPTIENPFPFIKDVIEDIPHYDRYRITDDGVSSRTYSFVYASKPFSAIPVLTSSMLSKIIEHYFISGIYEDTDKGNLYLTGRLSDTEDRLKALNELLFYYDASVMFQATDKKTIQDLKKRDKYFAEYNDLLTVVVNARRGAKATKSFTEAQRKSIAEQLRTKGDALQKQIDNKMNPAIASLNVTNRRATIAENMRYDGERLMKFQAVFRGLADLWESDQVPKYLKGIRYNTEVELIYWRKDYPVISENIALWAIEQYEKEQAQLEKLGITNDTQFQEARNALLELAEMGELSEAEKLQREIKKKENKLIGVKIDGFFPTPLELVKEIVLEAKLEDGMTVLEPSAGKGDIADYIAENFNVKLEVVEQSPTLREFLKLKKHNLVGSNILEHTGQYDRIVMNPPFEKKQDIEHVEYCFNKLLKPGGILVSVMGEGAFFRPHKKDEDFRGFVEEHGYSVELGQRFKGSQSFRQTGVISRYVVLEKDFTESVRPEVPKTPEAPKKDYVKTAKSLFDKYCKPKPSKKSDKLLEDLKERVQAILDLNNPYYEDKEEGLKELLKLTKLPTSKFGVGDVLRFKRAKKAFKVTEKLGYQSPALPKLIMDYKAVWLDDGKSLEFDDREDIVYSDTSKNPTVEVDKVKESIESTQINLPEPTNEDNNGTYKINEKGKLEIYFDYEYYKGMPDDDKKGFKRYFLWSRGKKAWISKSKFGDSYTHEQLIKQHNLIFEGKEEALSFEDKVSQQKSNAEYKAERAEVRAAKAQDKAKDLQSTFKRLAKDWSWLTQPNINSSSGRSFTRSRNRIFDQYERGFEEYKKSDYYLDKLKTYEATAKQSKLKDKNFLAAKIKEIDKSIKKRSEWMPEYIEEINNLPDLQENQFRKQRALISIDEYNELFEQKAFYTALLEDLKAKGEIVYSKETMKGAEYVKYSNSWHKVKKLNPKTVVISWFWGMDGATSGWKAPYEKIQDAVFKGENYKVTPTHTNYTFKIEKESLKGLSGIRKAQALKDKYCKPLPSSSTLSVVGFPIDKINIDKKSFQNRDEDYSKESVERIVNAVKEGTFDFSLFDPVLIWRNRKENKHYMLSGHSRLEAFKRLSKKDDRFKLIPAKINDKLTKEEAMEVARKSNTLSTKETDIERANYYRNLRIGGTPEKEISTLAKENEGKNNRKILNYSFLNPNGLLLNSIKELEGKDQASFKNIETIANWIGEARLRYPKLSNSHENELANWLLEGAYGTKKGQISNKLSFLDKVVSAYNKNLNFGEFDASKPLNIKRNVTKNPAEQQWENQVRELESEMKKARKVYDDKTEEFHRGADQGKISRERAEELLTPYRQAWTVIRSKYNKLAAKKFDVARQGQAQASLFGYLNDFTTSLNGIKI